MRANFTRFCELANFLCGMLAPDAVVLAEELGGFVEHRVCDLTTVISFEESPLHVRGLVSYACSRLMDGVSTFKMKSRNFFNVESFNFQKAGATFKDVPSFQTLGVESP